ncbi:ABC transporter permease [bacterium]|nr:ABC transporter permease [bacterium]
MAFRNIIRHRRRSFFTALMIIGAFTFFSVSLGMVEGSYSRIIDMFTGNKTGHIQIHGKGYIDKPSIYNTLNDHDAIADTLENIEGIEAWTPRMFAPALAFVNTKTTGVSIRGIDPERESRTTRIRGKLIDGEYLSAEPQMEVMLSKPLARILNAEPGSEVVLIGQGADGSVANDIFTVSGIVNEEDRGSLYMHIEIAGEFIYLQGKVHEIAVILREHEASREMAGKIENIINDPGIEVLPWQQIEKGFYRAMEMDKQGNWITQFIIMFITALGVLNTVLMSILERTREFGVLRALGTRPHQIFALILSEASMLSIIGIVGGIVFSIATNQYLSVYGIALPEPVALEGMKFESYVSKVTAMTIYLPAVVTFVVAVGVSVFPAIRAARIMPVDALRAN